MAASNMTQVAEYGEVDGCIFPPLFTSTSPHMQPISGDEKFIVL